MTCPDCAGSGRAPEGGPTLDIRRLFRKIPPESAPAPGGRPSLSDNRSAPPRAPRHDLNPASGTPRERGRQDPRSETKSRGADRLESAHSVPRQVAHAALGLRVRLGAAHRQQPGAVLLRAAQAGIEKARAERDVGQAAGPGLPAVALSGGTPGSSAPLPQSTRGAPARRP